MKKIKILTLKDLERMGVCFRARNSFLETFGRKAKVGKVVEKLHEKKETNWEGWLLAQKPNLTLFLLKHGANVHADDDGALRWAARDGHAKVVEVLLEHGANVHAYDDCALEWAAEDGRAKVVEILLEHGADVHANNDGALRWAAEDGHAKVVEILLKHGANVHADDDGALRWAAERGHFGTVSLLKKWIAKNVTA